MVRRIFLLAVLTSCLAVWLAPLSARTDDKPNSATTPEARPDGWWQGRQKSFNERVAKGNAELLFIGDSITQGWEDQGKEVWKKQYDSRGAVNLGIGGDRTQHVLWRLENGNLEGIRPKLAVLMIGTNNVDANTPEEIGAGIKTIVEKLRSKLPETKVLVLAVFPRGEKPNPQRDKIAQVNKIAAELADGKNVYYLDIGPKFLSDDGTIGKEIMPDFLHLSPKGYEIWAAAIEPTVAKLMGENTTGK